MILDYLKERYDEHDLYPLDYESVVKKWDELQASLGTSTFKTAEGFCTYALVGDAAIIYDMYVKPEFRGHTSARILHDHIMDEAKAAGKRIAITFSEFKGKNHMAGIKAMKIAGFIPAWTTNTEFIFVKGI